MAVTFPVALRACCVAVGLLLSAAHAAEPVSPLLGLSRDQLLSRNGEPKSQMQAGNRVIYFYPRERVVLRDNVVIQVEPVAEEPGPPPPAAPAASTATAEEGTAPGARTAPPAQTPPPVAPEPKVEIKLVRPPSKDGRPAPVLEPPRPAPIPALPPADATAPGDPMKAPPPKTAVSPRDATPVPKNAETAVSPADSPRTDTAPAGPKEKTSETPAPKAPATESPTPAGATAEPNSAQPTYWIVWAAVGGLLIFLFWRYRQRQLELAASSVENTPVTSDAAPLLSGDSFNLEMLSALEWKPFEELVSSYYNKTGVVAVRTKAGPESAVHLKISWKGEPRPFAYVQCIAQPTTIIDAAPLQALAAALAADDIRRGYVVTAGQFNASAREFAAAKHLTLLPGDVFVEKLNALPASARTEIVKSVSAAG